MDQVRMESWQKNCDTKLAQSIRTTPISQPLPLIRENRQSGQDGSWISPHQVCIPHWFSILVSNRVDDFEQGGTAAI